MITTNDSLKSLLGSLGNPDRDKAASTYYVAQFVGDDQLAAAYKSSWLARKIVNIPAHDSVRAWRDWQAKGDQIGKIEAEEQRLGVVHAVKKARVLARLWGGAVIYLGTDDKNVEIPFDPASVRRGGLKYLSVMSRRDGLQAGPLQTDPTEPNYGKPTYFMLGSRRFHPSRFVVFDGHTNPDPFMNFGPSYGWGDSVLYAVFQTIKDADATVRNIASLVFEANIDVFGIPNLLQSVGDAGWRDTLTERMALAAANKGINGSIVMDSSETYERKEITFGGLNDILNSFMQLVSGAADIPATRLLSQSPAGLNSTGESDLRNYYDAISAGQQLDISPAMRPLDECLIRSALGDRPDAVWYNWAPLWQLSSNERATIGKTYSETAKILVETGLVQPEALSRAIVNRLTEDAIFPGLEQDNVTPDFDLGDMLPRTLYVSRPVMNVDEITAWAEAQGFTDIVPDLHVTVIYSKTPVDWALMGESYSEELTIPAGGPRMVEQFNDNAVVLEFASSDLKWRHESMVERGATTDYPEYRPHITISYAGMPDGPVEPYQGRIVLGPEVFREVRS